jgi:DNA polymerase III delta prime subunit
MEPIHSRCTCIDFKLNGSKAAMASRFFKRVESILLLEHVKYDKEVVAALITKHFPDNRRILNELQRYSVSGTIDNGILSNIVDINLAELIKTIKDKDFGSMRKWVTQNLDNDPVRIYRKIYDSLYDNLKPNSIPNAVMILAKYQYQAAFVADQEINLVACLTEFMVELELK